MFSTLIAFVSQFLEPVKRAEAEIRRLDKRISVAQRRFYNARVRLSEMDIEELLQLRHRRDFLVAWLAQQGQDKLPEPRRPAPPMPRIIIKP